MSTRRWSQRGLYYPLNLQLLQRTTLLLSSIRAIDALSGDSCQARSDITSLRGWRPSPIRRRSHIKGWVPKPLALLGIPYPYFPLVWDATCFTYIYISKVAFCPIVESALPSHYITPHLERLIHSLRITFWQMVIRILMLESTHHPSNPDSPTFSCYLSLW